MKIIQVNAWLGRLNGPLERFIEAEQPDIICMQETFEPNPEAPKTFADQYNFIEKIQQLSGLGHRYFAPAFGFPIGPTVMDTGVTILSRYPISDQQAFHTFREYYVYDSAEAHLSNARVWQACTVTLPDGACMSVANYHGYLAGPHGVGDEMTTETMRKVRDAVSRLEHPIIFCGDFNIWTGAPALGVMNDLPLHDLTADNNVLTTLSDVHRASAEDRAKAPCDHVFVSNEMQVKSFAVSDIVVSDHKALVIELDP